MLLYIILQQCSGERIDVLSAIQTLQQDGFSSCQLAVFFHPTWTNTANIVRLSSSNSIVLINSNLELTEKISVVKKTVEGGSLQEWCVGWILLLENLKDLEKVIDFIRYLI